MGKESASRGKSWKSRCCGYSWLSLHGPGSLQACCSWETPFSMVIEEVLLLMQKRGRKLHSY
jgi:hypothetical protein